MGRGSSPDQPEGAQQPRPGGVAGSMDEPLPQVEETVFALGAIRRVSARSSESLIVDAFERHQGELNGFALQLTRNPDVAADLVQEAFLRLVREVKAGRSPDNVRPWLYRVVANLAASRGRRATVAARWQARQTRPDTAEAPERGFLEKEFSIEVKSLLQHVSNDERTALVLSAHGFAGTEIAAVLGRSHLGTRALLCRARARLRDQALALETTR